MKRAIFILLPLAILILAFATSCRKDNPDDMSNMEHVRIFNSYETISNDIFKIFLNSVIAVNDSLYHPNDSTNLRFDATGISFVLNSSDTNTWPKTLHIVFPGNNHYDGILRSGEIIVELPTPALPVNSEFNITFNNFSINNIVISGNKKIHVTDDDPLSFVDTSRIIAISIAPSAEWSSSHLIEWALGSSTHQNISDDLFIYNGNASYSTLLDSETGLLNFSSNIIEALQFANYCYWIGSGKAEIVPYNLPVRTITYLDSCFNQAVVSADNKNFNIIF